VDIPYDVPYYPMYPPPYYPYNGSPYSPYIPQF